MLISERESARRTPPVSKPAPVAGLSGVIESDSALSTDDFNNLKSLRIRRLAARMFSSSITGDEESINLLRLLFDFNLLLNFYY